MMCRLAKGTNMNAISLLASSNYIVVNKTLVKELGLECAVLLGELAGEALYWTERDGLEDGYFFSTIENVEEMTGLSGHKQRKALQTLQDKGYVDIVYKGMPSKRYVRLNDFFAQETVESDDEILDDISPENESPVVKNFNNKELKNLTTSRSKIEQQVVKNFNGKNNKLRIIKKNNKEIYKESPPANEIAEIYEYLNEQLGTRYKPTTKANASLVHARLEEGFTVDDFKVVIDTKLSEWGNDEQMRKFLRPQTLFAPTKFESYLNQAAVKGVSGGVSKFCTERDVGTENNDPLADWRGHGY